MIRLVMAAVAVVSMRTAKLHVQMDLDDKHRMDLNEFYGRMKRTGADAVQVAPNMRLDMPTPERRKRMLGILAETLAFFRERNVPTTVWSSTLGYGGDLPKYLRGRFEGSARVSTAKGQVGSDVFCPTDEAMFGGHLFYPFYPAESFLDRAAAEGTLAWFWKYGADVSYLGKRPHAISEWAAYYTGVAELRLYGGARGWTALRNFLSDYGKPNGLFSHNAVMIEDPSAAEAARERAAKPTWKWRRAGADVTLNPRAKAIVPAVIEGSGAFVFMGAEALLQSWGGEIRLFPGVPEDFTGEFRDFLVQGGRRVSAKMVKGKVVWKEIR